MLDLKQQNDEIKISYSFYNENNILKALEYINANINVAVKNNDKNRVCI